MTGVPLFLCGDVMTGRGIDQILRAPCDPGIHEPHLNSALEYVRLAEEASGLIPRAAAPEYVWGDALAELARAMPAARIVNLETAVTRSGDWLPKGINYRMSPENAACLRAAALDCCVLANNHVLDWGRRGLEETLDTLRAAGIRSAGAGRTLEEAEAPAVLPLAGGGRLLVYALAHESSGVPPEWAAQPQRPGVAHLTDLSQRTAERLRSRMAAARRAGDLVVASVHWGGNWGYAVSAEERRFARALVAPGGADLFHGHSSHHPKAIEVHGGRPILYGCGDLINDYEGIGGHEAFRPGLGLMYFPVLDAASGELLELAMTPLRMERFRAARAGEDDCRWLAARLDGECRALGARVVRRAEHRLDLEWGA